MRTEKKHRDLLAADVVTVLKQRNSEDPSEPVTWRNVWDVIKSKEVKKDGK